MLTSLKKVASLKDPLAESNGGKLCRGIACSSKYIVMCTDGGSTMIFLLPPPELSTSDTITDSDFILVKRFDHFAEWSTWNFSPSSFSFDETYLAMSGPNKMIHFYDVENEFTPKYRLNQKGMCQAVSFHCYSNLFVASNCSGALMTIKNVDDGQNTSNDEENTNTTNQVIELFPDVVNEEAHQGKIAKVNFCRSKEHKLFLSLGEDRVVKIFDALTLSAVVVFNEHLTYYYSAVFSSSFLTPEKVIIPPQTIGDFCSVCYSIPLEKLKDPKTVLPITQEQLTVVSKLQRGSGSGPSEMKLSCLFGGKFSVSLCHKHLLLHEITSGKLLADLDSNSGGWALGVDVQEKFFFVNQDDGTVAVFTNPLHEIVWSKKKIVVQIRELSLSKFRDCFSIFNVCVLVAQYIPCVSVSQEYSS